ncbi:two-component system sensor histidine kinase NtrB [Siculibacillus lacustris]|uniref:two-component system sensor histidine kinase NtrB n=1 Tax=Siculibacillus lacustris TaxID=1549641 RepID=UPI001D18B06B|nr:PAS domain S-box protein [Siculibacillus lacustris]
MTSQPPTVSEARLLSVLDTAVDGIIVIDERGRMLIFNKACEDLFGYPVAEMVGRNVRELMPPEFSVDHDSYLANYLATGERRIIGIGREVRGRHADGTVFPIELSVGEARTPDGRQFIGIIRDLRQRKAVEQRLNQLQAQLVQMARVNAMDEMGAAIAHELNQPLTAVMLYLQALKRKLTRDGDETGPDPAILEILSKASREAERASSIIQRMRHFVEKREPDRQAVDLGKLIDEALELTLLGNDGAGVEVVRDEAIDLPRIEVDPVQIQQILINLIRNAIEAVRTRQERWIRIAVRVGEGRLSVEVEDSGAGIPKETVRSLFKAFATSKKSGLGLGLAISRSIAQNHGGDLLVEPGGEGRGATFVLSLPLTPAASGKAG